MTEIGDLFVRDGSLPTVWRQRNEISFGLTDKSNERGVYIRSVTFYVLNFLPSFYAIQLSLGKLLTRSTVKHSLSNRRGRSRGGGG